VVIVRSLVKTGDLGNVLSVYMTWRWEPGGNESGSRICGFATSDVVETPANAFYDRLNQILDEHKFDAKVERLPQVL
jgi:hypothetical protein